MKPSNQFLRDLLDLEQPQAAEDRIWRVACPTAAQIVDGDLHLSVPFEALLRGFKTLPDPAVPRRSARLVFRAYGDDIVRFFSAFDSEATPLPDSPMLEWASDLRPVPLSCVVRPDGWEALDQRGRVRVRIITSNPVLEPWQKNDTMALPQEPFAITVLPDGVTPIPFQCPDTFFPMCSESFPLAFIERKGRIDRHTFSLHADTNERYAGTGERFAHLDLSGRTLILENADGLGVNNRRCYKNIPFYLSSRPYGLFIHSHDHQRLSLADVSTRAAQAVVESPAVDLFFIGGGHPERILHNYRRITGFPPEVPVWSLGTWMSRMTYSSEEQVNQIATRLRDEKFPCDVLHVDVGWFAEEWVCDWEFDSTRFPNPQKWIANLRKKGFRISLWQLPHVAKVSKLYREVMDKGLARFDEATGKISDSIFSGLEFVATIDMTNPEAVEWYKNRLRPLLKMGVASLKTAFGEHIQINLDYHTMSGKRLQNLFGLLYQRAIFEASREFSDKPVIFARTGWAGSQRYPLHWGGDCACSWDGLAGSLRGGLHFGASGFAHWTCDVPGFHGVPDFSRSWPSDNVYLRWTQTAIFLSHIRYHGAQPREPYEYPRIADLVRKWWRLRYALIPYLIEAGRQSSQSGFPIMRALFFHDPSDPLCWTLDDQFLCGNDLLIAPVLNDSGVRSVYLPKGEWVDFWTGEQFQGPRWINNLASTPGRIPVFVRKNARIPVYPDAVLCTDEMDLSRTITLVMDNTYQGLARSPIGPMIGLT